MTQVYSDQIWLKSRCRDLETEAKHLIEKAGGEPYLVDAVDVSKSRHKKLVTDNLTEIDHIPLYPEFWGTYSYDPVYESAVPTKIFNCFINRVCTTRQLWFYEFVRKDLIDFANISFLLDNRLLPPGEPGGVELYEKNFQVHKVFEHEHNLMRDRVPFCNFVGDLDQVVIDTHISLVIETYFDWPGTITFSEKIFRALQLPRPFILYSMPGSVDVLRKYEFDVWDDIIDHSYESEPNPIRRQHRILDQLCAWRERSFSSDQLIEFEQRANNNRALLKTLRHNWPKRLKTATDQLKS